jgi:hypothetical protein
MLVEGEDFDMSSWSCWPSSPILEVSQASIWNISQYIVGQEQWQSMSKRMNAPFPPPSSS